MGPTPALACQVPPIHEVLGPTHLDIPLLTGFLSPPQGFEPVTKSLRSLGKHPCYQLSYLLDFLFLGKESLDPIGLPRFRRGLDALAIAFPESPIGISICAGVLTARICDFITLFGSVKASGN